MHRVECKTGAVLLATSLNCFGLIADYPLTITGNHAIIHPRAEGIPPKPVEDRTMSNIDITGYYSTTDHEYRAAVSEDEYNDGEYSVTIERLGASGENEESEYLQCDFGYCITVDGVGRLLNRYAIELNPKNYAETLDNDQFTG